VESSENRRIRASGECGRMTIIVFLHRCRDAMDVSVLDEKKILVE
jgi:hypothetical protein